MLLSLQPKIPNYPVLFGLVSPKPNRMSKSYHLAEVPPSVNSMAEVPHSANPMADVPPKDIVDIMAAIPSAAHSIQQTFLSSFVKEDVRTSSIMENLDSLTNTTSSFMQTDENQFCSGPLWDSKLTWFTEYPDFTACFELTVLTYLPTLILLIGLPFQIYNSYNSRNRMVPWGFCNVTKILLISVLICISLVEIAILVHAKNQGRDVPDVLPTADGARIFNYIVAIILLVVCKKRGEVTSGPLFLFWLSASVCGAPTFRSALMSDYLTGSERIAPVLIFTIQYPIVLLIFILSFWADNKPKYIDLEVDADNLTPEIFASFPSKMTFSWFDAFAWTGWKRVLKHEDLWTLSLKNRCSFVVPLWDKHWNKCVEKAQKAKKDVSILTALVKSFGIDYMWSSILYFIYSLLLFVSPQVVNLIIGFVQANKDTEPVWRGYLYVSVIILATIVNSVINAQYWYIQWLIGLRVRTALTSAIYRKSLRLSNKAKREMTVGETTNLMSIDTQKFMDLVLYLNMIWSSPLQIILCLYFLWGILGPSSLAGLAVMVLMIPLNSIVADKMKAYQKEQMANKDIRTKLMDEVLNGIKVLKLYAWEPSFSLKVLDVRRREIKSLKKVAYLNAFTTFLWTCAPFLVAVSSFTVYVLIDENNILDAQTAFVSLTYFNLLRAPLNFLPMLLVYLIQCSVSLKRVNKFMNAEELDPLNVTHDDDFNHPVYAEQADFTWENEGNPNLKDISMRIDEGSLVAIVGSVGSGKSSVLSALLGEMKRTKGVVNVRGKVAYTTQQAWIQNGTLQSNIIFGKRYNKDLYNKVIEACALEPDIKMLPGGDQIEIGEKGINLSGGQKQRVSIARSVYSNSNVYFLDDPLSAVDAHVGKHIFDKVIGSKGILRNKTRLLVTHAINYLPKVDKIIVMNEGRITEMGTYSQLLNKKGDFADFLVQFLSNNEKIEDPVTDAELNEIKSNLENTIGKKNLARQISKAQSDKSTVNSGMSAITTMERKSSDKDRSTRREHFNSTSQSITEHMVEANQVGQNLIETEKLEEGGVKWGVYKYYADSVGMFAFLSSIMFYVIYQGFSVGANIWLSKWSDDATANITSVRNKYLAVYGTLGILQSVSIMFATTVFAIFTLDAATKLHDTMLMRILRAPMSFFDTTPTGRMLNRFSKDIDIIDTTVPMNFRMLFNQLLNVLGTVFVVIFAMPIFILVVIPIAIVYYFIQKFYVATARQVKRMESISRSPIYNHFSETITGAPTIRAFNRVKTFTEESEKRVDDNQICYYPAIVSNRWLGIRLELIGNIFIMSASIFAVATRGTIDAGLVGLSLSYALNVSNSLSMLVRVSSDVETNMVSVERIQEYQEVPQEAPFSVPENDPHAGWPEYGVINFENYQTRYREGLDLVLKGLNCSIKSGEKIGIVGRTGAGKSSLTLALFRIIESASGCITIDGVNIAHLGLGKLRSRITIIPQDPVLFAGSLRMNLDPFEQYTDRDIWSALDHAHLKMTVSALLGGLQFTVTEGGENLSVGQRQLICLARALLRKTKVLILDEATAAVDLETDELVQSTIRQEFNDCTVITIAHRLNTIMDSNRVMVLYQGQIAEFESPQNLLANPNSIFYGMANSANH